ncbi:hypothetical protein M422DRAFT_264648 [Sphaerobolus stellatus SS14]|uniref:Uncharacterized protein n=1 Tax=Sphaerobolus stellatus (strain SS14) TaxID=990650 RepID=A0A0C9V7S4_SPHS4|nr:hypothetical protein M422DRAFT_264648 [Sphaerobolus stellatus SS14]
MPNGTNRLCTPVVGCIVHRRGGGLPCNQGILCVEFDTIIPTVCTRHRRHRLSPPAPRRPTHPSPNSAPSTRFLKSLEALHSASSPLGVIAQRHGCQGARRASAAPTTSRLCLPAPLPRVRRAPTIPTCAYRLPLSLPFSPTRSLGRWRALYLPALLPVLRNGRHGARRAPAVPPAPLPGPPLSLAPQSSLAGPTPASTFLGVLYYETDASGMWFHQSPRAPITSRPPFPVLHGLPGDELASPHDNHDAWCITISAPPPPPPFCLAAGRFSASPHTVASHTTGLAAVTMRVLVEGPAGLLAVSKPVLLAKPASLTSSHNASICR